MDDYVELRCRSCGNVLVPKDTTSDTIECEYCGAIQQRVDSKKYLEQVKGEMMAWLSKAIPSGLGQNATESMDPIARHNIFVSSISPSIENEMDNYRFSMMSILGYPLVLVPHDRYDKMNVRHDTKKVFELDAKTKSVSQLAVNDESKKLLATASAVSVAYASIINNANLFKTDGAERYSFATNNLNQAAEAMKDIPEMKYIYERLSALALLSDGVEDIIEGRAPFARSKIEEAKQRLSDLLPKILDDLDYSIMFKAIKAEIAVCDTMLLIASAVSENPSLDPSTVLGTASNLIQEMEREESFVTGEWVMQMRRAERSTDIFKLFGEILGSKSGQHNFKVAKGEGNYYVPMWAVEVTYKFTTGALFRKRTVEVIEMIFMSSDFISDTLSMSRCAPFVTDVFGSIPESTFFQRIKGEETSISMGGCVRGVYNEAMMSMIPTGAQCVAPLCTAREAEIFCNKYLNESKSMHPKLTMGKAVVKELVLVPFKVSNGKWICGAGLGNLVPKHIGDEESMKKISI